MDITQTAQPNTVSQRQTTRETSSGDAMLTSDFETFLNMLTTQMQNQDPLNPMESTELATQLAQFSSVEQQVYTNDLLEDLQASMTTQTMSDLGSWIGMEARADMPVSFQGTPVTIAGAQDALADRMELIVRDPQGRVLQQSPIPLSDEPLQWAARGADGNTLPYGTYSLSVQNWRGEEMLSEAPAMVYGAIEEAQVIDGAVWLTVEGGSQIQSSAVSGLRAPTAP
jgi:flagellar basal-body rod modification protein FlgD